MTHAALIHGIGAQERRPPGRPKSRSDAAERERITTQACELFLATGYGGTTMDAVAARCGISKRTLYRLFPGKTDLFRAMVADHRRQALALPHLATEQPLEQALAAIFRLDETQSADRDRIAFILLAIAEAEHFPEIGALLLQEAVEPSRRLLADWIGAQQAAGRLRPFPAEAAARMLLDMMFGERTHRFLECGHDERVAHGKLCIDVFLRGLAP